MSAPTLDSSDDAQPSSGDDPPLTTGWESDLAAGDTVVRQFVCALAGRLQRQAEVVGGRWRRDALALVADTGSVAPYENGVVLLRPPRPGEVEGLLGDARSLLPRDRDWVLYSPFPLTDPLPGLDLVGHPPLMVRPAGGAAPPSAPGVEIRPVESAADLALAGRVVAASFGLAEGDAAEVFDRRLLGGPSRYWLAWADGEAVGVGAARATDGFTEVALIGTVAQVRRRGIGEALTWVATLAGGAQPAGLLASDLGQPVYRRMGYLPLLRFTLWHARGNG